MFVTGEFATMQTFWMDENRMQLDVTVLNVGKEHPIANEMRQAVSKNRQSRNNFQIIAVLLTLVALALAGCGGDDETPTAVPPTPDTVAVAPTVVPTAAERDLSTPTPAQPQESPVQTPASEESYPAPVEAASAQTGYPAPVTATPETSRIPIVPFVLDRPLEPGATVVSGSGPANVPIVIANVFLMGEIIGEGTIGADGHFSFPISPTLETGHWIGIALDNLTDSEFAYEDFYAQGFRGPGAEQVPQVGFIYDSEFVR